MTAEHKFEETYGQQTQEKVAFQSNSHGQEKIHMHNHPNSTQSQFLSVGRLIFIILLVAAALFIGGIFSMIALATAALIAVVSFIARLLTFSSGDGSISKRY
ncbi:MAG: hypothetical protein KDK51_07360 [Deltaproteobacteria bacterium]|nr:hypothetical protein [Deltaproteobacteria bacterium]